MTWISLKMSIMDKSRKLGRLGSAKAESRERRVR
jgi:hypothetical protein